MASGVDTEFPYRVRIVDRGLIAYDPVCRHRFRFSELRHPLRTETLTFSGVGHLADFLGLGEHLKGHLKGRQLSGRLSGRLSGASYSGRRSGRLNGRLLCEIFENISPSKVPASLLP